MWGQRDVTGLAPQWWLPGATVADLAEGVDRHGMGRRKGRRKGNGMGGIDLYSEPLLWGVPSRLPTGLSVGANTSSVARGVGGWLAAGRPFSTSAIASVASGPGAGVYPGGDEAWGDVDCVLHSATN